MNHYEPSIHPGNINMLFIPTSFPRSSCKALCESRSEVEMLFFMAHPSEEQEVWMAPVGDGGNSIVMGVPQ